MRLTGRDEQPGGTSDKTEDLKPDPPQPVSQKHGANNPDEQQNIEQRRPLCRDQIIMDQICNIQSVLALMPDSCSKSDRPENTDPLGSKVL